MLAETSGVAIDIQLETVPRPTGVDMARWLRSFPSFGFLLTAQPEHAPAICAAFARSGISAAVCGDVQEGSSVQLTTRETSIPFWDYARTPYLNLSGQEAAHA